MSTTAIQCPVSARPTGFDRAVMVLGNAMTDWAQHHADAKAMRRRRGSLAYLSDAERADLYREATALREAAYAGRVQWHAIG